MKLKRQISAIVAVAAFFAMLPAVILAQSTNYQFEANSTYSINQGFVVFSSPLSGTFTLNEDFSLGQATITNAAVQLSPTTLDPTAFPLTTAAGVEAWLESETFVVAPSIANLNVWELSNPSAFFNETFAISVDNVSADRLATITGGASFGNIAVDGGGTFEFNATATAVVPEPTGSLAWLLLGIAWANRRGRRQVALSTA